MSSYLLKTLRVVITLLIAALACWQGWRLWTTYMNAPWTRDGQVRADIVGIAPDVSGLVTRVAVEDNQPVKKGDLLLVIDRDRFTLALQLSEAAVTSARAAMEQANRDALRYKTLGRNVTTLEQIEQSATNALKAQAGHQQAIAERDIARLNLQRSEIRAPSDGVITNKEIHVGDYATAGKPLLTLVDSSSIRIEGYFEETRLPNIRQGDPVKITLMGQNKPIMGRVESIAAGIADRERADGSGLLANVTPTFNWVRLAKRVPVRVALDEIPDGTDLLVGLSATVEINPPADDGKGITNWLKTLFGD